MHTTDTGTQQTEPDTTLQGFKPDEFNTLAIELIRKLRSWDDAFSILLQNATEQEKEHNIESMQSIIHLVHVLNKQLDKNKKEPTLIENLQNYIYDRYGELFVFESDGKNKGTTHNEKA